MTDDENSLRSMNCELNQLTMPDGSSMFMQGKTAVVAGVYGPVEARLQKLMYDKATVEVCFSPAKGPPSIDDRMKELLIKEACETALITALHPSTAININIQELDDSGGLLACAVNAVYLALINANLSMKCMLAAVNCMIDGNSGKIVLDPDSSQLQDAKATFTYIFESSAKNMVSCYTTGRFTETQLIESMNKCKDASGYVFDFYRNIVKKYARNV